MLAQIIEKPNFRDAFLVAILLTTLVYAVGRRVFAQTSLPPGVARFDRTDAGWISFASLRSITDFKISMKQGHEKYSKLDKPFICPHFLDGPLVILPPSALSDVLRQPEQTLSAQKVQDAMTETEYTTGDLRFEHAGIHQGLVRQRLTAPGVVSLVPAMADEIRLALAEDWGEDSSSWHDVNLLESVMRVVARTTNRMIAGEALCRDAHFLDICRRYTEILLGIAALIKLFPLWTRHLVAPLLTYPIRRLVRGAYKSTKPVILARLALNEQTKSDDIPNDYLQWLIDEAKRRNDPWELRPETMSRRIVLLNFVAIHSSTMTATNALLDLLSDRTSKAELDSLQQECAREYANAGECWTGDAVQRLVKLDSAVKESLRLRPLSMRGVERL
ncbi:hypothetical protein B0A48_08402 [Cryoendolithus antarcticus]|uniref:Cytochrome P450 n=1 Tax=Cryoendolithus antarcticus TaxID=1507870 RepID=A0A1V8T5C5_9PEZI|nr:hypothetical protein B0A48_08402 [Cryoendolithus antarcticus]